MNSFQTELSLIKEKFPGCKTIIEDLYKNDSDFKSLCADLFLCSKLIHDFESEIAEKRNVLSEYTEIVQELELELAMVIKSNGAHH
jgi:hypothetical protein